MKHYIVKLQDNVYDIQATSSGIPAGMIAELPEGVTPNDLAFLDITEREVVTHETVEVQAVDSETGELLFDEENNPVMIEQVVDKTHLDFLIIFNHDRKAQAENEKLQALRDLKLDELRVLREPLLKEADHMINDIVLGLRSDVEAVKVYREALKDMTEIYKDNPELLDGLDLNNVEWPLL